VILMLPYLATMAVMMPTFRRLQIPAFLGRNYDRERRMLL
jgi:simple sugar transport system permease protein